MIDLICGIFSFAFGMIKMGFGLAWGVVQFVLGLLGGIFSLIMSLGGLLLAGGLILLAVFRRKEYKQHRSQPYAENSAEKKVYDVDSEEFTSFYDQFRTEQQ